MRPPGVLSLVARKKATPAAAAAAATPAVAAAIILPLFDEPFLPAVFFELDELFDELDLLPALDWPAAAPVAPDLAAVLFFDEEVDFLPPLDFVAVLFLGVELLVEPLWVEVDLVEPLDFFGLVVLLLLLPLLVFFVAIDSLHGSCVSSDIGQSDRGRERVRPFREHRGEFMFHPVEMSNMHA